MELDINKATQPYEYYLKFIKQNCRPDQRKLSDIRPCNVIVNCLNTVNGSALVKLGATNVICGVSARLCRPREDRPDRGFVLCNVELPALCSSKNFKTSASHQSSGGGNSSASGSGGGGSQQSSSSLEQSQSMLTQLMQDIVAESRCVRDEDLCIRAGKLAWALYVDLICLNNDGNVQDACCLAMVSALKSARLCAVDYDEAESRPVVRWPLQLAAVPMHSEPVATTLFLLDESILLSDPNKQEEEFMRTFVTVCTLDERTMCLVRKFGGYAITTDQVNMCIERALHNGTYLRKQVLAQQQQQQNDTAQLLDETAIMVLG